MLLEAQLEKQLESISISQSCAEEVEQVIFNTLQHLHSPQEVFDLQMKNQHCVRFCSLSAKDLVNSDSESA